jgi:hypothetical protein
MNKYLLMSAAAVLATAAGSTGASAQSFQFGTAYGGSYCDGGTVTANGVVWAWAHTNNDCYGSTSYGQGLQGKVKGMGKLADMSDGIFGNSAFTINFVLPAKLKNGAPWSLWCQFSGTSSFECNSGPLINVGAAKVHPASKKSTITNVKALIQQHKASKKA